MKVTGSTAFALLVTASVFIEALAGGVCYVGQELRGGRGRASYTWVLNTQDPCTCTDIRIGGVNGAAAGGSYGIDLGKDFKSAFSRLTQQCRTQSATTVAMSTCGDKTIRVGSNSPSDGYPFSISQSGQGQLAFRVEAGSGSSISREVIRLMQDEHNVLYKVIITNMGVELKERVSDNDNQLGSPHNIGQDWWRTGHVLSIQTNYLTIDGTTILPDIDLPYLPRVQLVSFESESGVGATWTIKNTPCSWKL